MSYFPLNKEEAIQQGFKWSDANAPFPMVERVLKSTDIPPIQDVSDDILNQAIECEITKRPFRVIKKELEFYRKRHLPIPHRHPDVRNQERTQIRNSKTLWERKCDKC